MANKVTYLDHSGFMVEADGVIMVFDYYRDPAHKVEKTLDHNPETPVIFFVTHNHHDHFNHDIFNLGQNHKKQYVISNDVDSKNVRDDEAICWMSHDDNVEDLLGGVSVKAFSTTGKGCSFAVTTASGIKIFHAGELGEALSHNNGAPKEIEQFRNKFITAINRIASEENKFDLAMMSVNTVDGPDFAMGATKFIQSIQIGSFVPYHTDDSSDKACNFAAYPFTKNVDTRMICLTRPGESAEF